MMTDERLTEGSICDTNVVYERVIRKCQIGKNMIEITDVLNKLSKKRPVFHSEADFREALAQRIYEKYPGLSIKLRERINNVDISASNDNKTVAIEVRHKTKHLDATINDEEFHLKNHSARDQGRYDFIKDISKLEKVLRYPDDVGFAILLTNDELYWETPARNYLHTLDREFRIHEGMSIKGELCWKEGTSEGTMSGRSESIKLKKEYALNWNDYSDMKKQNGKFRYLLVKIAHNNSV